MIVDKKAPAAITDDARDDSNRLKSSGMNRDRVDKNAVPDEFDFASLRAGLGGKKAGDTASSPAAAPASRQPSVAGASVKAGSPAQLPQPSPAAEPTIVPPTPQSVPRAASRQGSTTSLKATPSSPAGIPKSPAQPATPSPAASPSKSGSRAATPVEQSNSPPASRRGSGISHQPSAAEARAPTPTKAPSVAGSEPALSRRSSAVPSLSGDAPAASVHSISRHGSVASRHSTQSNQQAAASPAAPYSPTPTLPPRSQQAHVQDEEDWKSKAEYLKRQLAETEKQHSKKQQLLKAEKAEVDRQKNKVRDLERQLDEARHLRGGGGDDALRDQMARDRRTIEELETKLRESEKQAHTTSMQHRNSIASSRGATYGIPQEVVDRLQKDNVTLKAASEQKDQLIKQLSIQLESAHEAILASAAKGFEYDIKLHQARATLVTMLKGGSPRRTQSGSPVGTAPPTQYGSPQRSNYASPQRTSGYGYSPVIRTPASPQGGRSLY